MPTPPRPVMLVILDGWGWREETADNAMRQAHTPTFDRLWAGCPHAFLHTSGPRCRPARGADGQFRGRAHEIGAGRVVMQELPRIGAAIADGHRNGAGPGRADRSAEASGGTCHLMGLVSPGGVHSHQDHGVALAGMLARGGRAGRGARLHRRPRYPAAIRRRRFWRLRPRCRTARGSPPSAAATTPWTATSAGTGSPRPTRRSRRGRARASPTPPRSMDDAYAAA